MPSLTSAAIIGVVIGFIIAYLYSRYFSKKMSIPQYVTFIVVCNLMAASACLFVLAYMKPETTHIKKNPKLFAFEAFIVSVLSAVTLFVILYMRSMKIHTKASWTEFAIIFAKILVIHVLFEVTGFYKYALGTH